MSHDLSVYLPERVRPVLRRAGRGPGADGPDADGGGLLRRGGEYVADLGGPQPVEPGDIPQQVEPSHLLAGDTGIVAGIVEDPADELWSAGRTHRPSSPRTPPTPSTTAPRGSDDLPDADALPATWLSSELTTSGTEDPAARVPRGQRPSLWDGLPGWLPGRR